MPNSLTDLDINEVSIVDRPANSEKGIARARVALFKRADASDVLKAGAKGIQFVVGFPKGGGGSEVQSVLFDKTKWTVADAKTWLKANKFTGLAVDETENMLRFRQKDPDQYDRLRTITAGQSKCEKVLKAAVVKMFYPPLGNTSEQPKARTFKDVYASLEQMEEFQDMGEEFQEKVNALCQSVWTILADESVKDKQSAINSNVDQFVESVKEGLSEEDEEVHKAIDGGGYIVEKAGKTYAGKTFPKSDFAYTPDDIPSHWKLRLTKVPGGKPDARIVAGAVQALQPSGFRGKKAQIPASALSGVKAKVRAAWKDANPDKSADEMPEVIRKQGESMTLDQLEQEVTKLGPKVTALETENNVLKAENELVLKMTKKERKLYASMSDDERKAYMGADAAKRKAMMDKCKATMKEKALADSMDEATAKRFAAAGPIEKAALLAEQEEKVRKGKKAKPADGGDDDDDDDDLDGDSETTKALKRQLAATQDVINKQGQTIEQITKANTLAHFTKRAEDELPNTAGTPAEKGEMLMKMAEAAGGETSDLFKSYMAQLVAADRAIKATMTEVGKVGGGTVPVMKQIEAAVDVIAKRDNINKEHAMAKLLTEQPDLYLQYEAEQRAQVRQF